MGMGIPEPGIRASHNGEPQSQGGTLTFVRRRGGVHVASYMLVVHRPGQGGAVCS
jgi:hypothetical protein